MPPVSSMQIGDRSAEAHTESLKAGGHGLGNARIFLFIIVIGLVVSAPLVILLGNRSHPVSPTGGGGLSNGLQIFGGYDSLHSLRGNSTIVGLMTVGVIAETYPTLAIDGKPSGIVNTVFQLEVSSYVYGSGPPSVFVSIVPLPGDPIFVTGEEYVLFLINDWTSCDPAATPPCALPSTPLNMTYFVTGAAQGRFLVLNGLVYGFKTLYPLANSGLAIDAKGVPVDTFLSEVRDA